MSQSDTAITDYGRFFYLWGLLEQLQMFLSHRLQISILRKQVLRTYLQQNVLLGHKIKQEGQQKQSKVVQ